MGHDAARVLERGGGRSRRPTGGIDGRRNRSCEFGARKGRVGGEGADESIAALGERLDVARCLGSVAEGLAQPLDGVVQTAVEINEGIRGPDLPMEVLTCDDFASMLQQDAEEPKGLIL